MTRVLSIVVTLLAFCVVLAASSAFAVPVAATTTVQTAHEGTCTEPQVATPLAGKFCVKRHTLGLPCTPSPMILPVAYALAGAGAGPSTLPADAVQNIDPDWARLFRPPRAGAA